ncbi:MAG: prepilin-type N-terminal cleavage/methylation domain-containing protein [Vicinamibacterales bacterium]
MAGDDRARRDDGFTLIEVMIAMVIIVVGVIALGTAVATAARMLTASQDQLIATQRASEAVESVFKARDNRILNWDQIRNVVGAGGDGGIFADGPQDVRDPGPDGLVNTADDGAVENIVKPGPDGLLGTADDELTPLFGFTREIEIRDIRANLRVLRVIIRYRSSTGPAQYVLTTYISSYA